jgi:VRR-NUC domain
MPGTPDIVCCIDGQFVGLEVKGPKGDLSDAQKDFRQLLEKAGGRYHVVPTIEDVQSHGL